jgi:hypothetical protein
MDIVGYEIYDDGGAIHWLNNFGELQHHIENSSFLTFIFFVSP